MIEPLAVLLLLSSQPPTPSPEPSAPDRPPSGLTREEELTAEVLISNNCMTCHSQEMLAQQRLTEKQWASVTKKMQGWGSQLEPENTPLAVRYLSARYAPHTEPYVLLPLEAGEADKAVMALPDGVYKGGSPAEGKRIYDAMCMTCHGTIGEGGDTGMTLSGRPILNRAPDFARVIRSGRARMPSYTGISDAQIASVLSYLRRPEPSR